MRDELDIQQYDVAGDGFDDEPRFHPVHREALPHVITGGAPIVGASKTAAFENGEASAIHFLTEKIKSQSIIQLAFQMQKLLRLPLETVYMQMSAAWLRDTADQHVDCDETISEDNHWRWTHRYPRLSEFAHSHPGEFGLFQKAIGRFLVLPDLGSPHRTAKMIKAQRDADFAELRKEYDAKHPKLSRAA